jgi:hypothetical protein
VNEKATFPKPLLPDIKAGREITFRQTYDFMVAAASLQSRSGNREEAIVGERLFKFLCDQRKAAQQECIKP